MNERSVNPVSARSSWLSVAMVSCLLMVATVAAYWSVLSSDFVSFDDPQYVSGNGYVLGGLSWAGFSYAWTTWDCSNWHPLTWLSLELDGSVWRGNAVGYHATNLLLHVVNTVLLFLVLRRLTGSVGRSACVAALFALHPLHVESVAWISERKDVLSTLFLLLTVAAYIHYSLRPTIPRYCVVIALFGLGLLAKPMLVTLPVLLLLLDWWPLNRVAGMEQEAVLSQPRLVGQLLLEKLPLIALALFDALMTVNAQQEAAHRLGELSLPVRLGNLITAYAWYLQKTFVPTNLTVFYPHREQSFDGLTTGLSLLLLLAITAYVCWQGVARTAKPSGSDEPTDANRSVPRPYLIVGWAWFVISLLPVIGLVQVGGQAYADRYSYVPHIGLFVLIVWEAAAWLAAIKSGSAIGKGLVAVVLLICFTLTCLQASYWKNSDTLWSHAIAVDPDNYVAHFHLADLQQNEGHYEQAIKHLDAGLQTRRGSESANAHYNWGRCLLALHRDKEAEEQFQIALRLDEDHIRTLEELVKLLNKQNRQAEAAQMSERYESTLSRQAQNPHSDGATQLKLGLLRARQGHIAEAIPYFERAARLSPSAAAFNNLGLALEQVNRRNEAIANFRRAIELNSNLPNAHFNLARCLLAERDLPNAKKHFAEVVRLNPNDVEAQQQLKQLNGL